MSPEENLQPGWLIAASMLSAGLAIYPGLQSLWVAWSRHRPALHLAFALMCFCACGYQLTLVAYHLAPTLIAAGSALRWQFGLTDIFLGAFLVFTVEYTERARKNPWLLAVMGLLLLMFVINLSQPYSLRFTQLQSEPLLKLAADERLANFSGRAGWMSALARLLFSAVLVWSIWCAWLQYRRGARRMAGVFVLCVLLLFLASLWGAAIDLGWVSGFYTAGFAYVGMALFMSVHFAQELRERNHALRATTAELREEVVQRRSSDRTIRHIADGVGSEIGDRFFERLVLDLVQLFAADCAIVAARDPIEPRHLRLLAVHAGPDLTALQREALTSGVWAKSQGRQLHVQTRDARQCHPDDLLLRERAIDSYVVAPLFDLDGTELGLIVVMHRETMSHPARVVEVLEIFRARAVAEIQRLHGEDHIRQLAYQDPLTGLANRARFHEQLAEVHALALREASHGAVLMIDLDHFKSINNALSHAVGDLVLAEVARRLQAVAAGAWLARLGGDEFVLALHPASADATSAQRLATALAQEVLNVLKPPVAVSGHVLSLAASIGVAPFPVTAGGALDLLREVELALYRAKELGRGRIEFYAEGLKSGAAYRLSLAEGLRLALDGNQLALQYQPQTDADGRMIGAEALLRWQHPEHGSIAPGIFIAIAEQFGLIHALGNWVVDRVCGDLARWQRASVAEFGRLAINFSPWQLTRPDLVVELCSILERHGIRPQQLVIEITETALLYDLDVVIAKLHALRALGFMISLDDFGTGYSSLAYLRALPLDELKIDRSFVGDLHPGRNAALVQSIVAVSQHMGLQVIAEGVESATQRDVLSAMGCQRFQGYFFSEPLDEQDLLARLAPQPQGDAVSRLDSK